MINPYLDTLIGVAVIYFIFSVLAYVLQEFWAALRESRGKMLRKAIYDLLNDNLNKGYGVLLFDHPQFNFLKKTDNKLPSYLPSANFADALIDLISREAYDLRFPPDEKLPVKSVIAEEQFTPETNVIMTVSNMEMTRPEDVTAEKNLREHLPNKEEAFKLFKAGLLQLRTSNLKMLLQNILANSQNLENLRTNIETWYNGYMDRVTGWYKSKVTINLRWIGIGLAIIFNLHAFHIISSIYSDRQLRDKLVRTGESIVSEKGDFLQPIYSSNINYALANLDSVCSRQLREIEQDSTAQSNLTERRNRIEKECLDKRIAVADSFAQLRYRQAKEITDSLKIWELPIGWKLLNEPGNASEASGAAKPRPGKKWFWVILGWIASGLAISAGAPFWFNVLNKFFDVRRAGVRPETTTTK